MSLPRYAEYKDSGVSWLGKVPVHWNLAKVKHACSFSTGWTPPTGDSSAYEGENLWANISDLGAKVLSDTAKRISDKAVCDAGIKISPVGSLLFSFKLSVGQVSIAGADMYTNEAIATFRASPKLRVEYAYYAFPIFLIKNASENIYGAKLLNQELIKSAFLPLPSAEEQSAIAIFLDRETGKIDAMIAEQEKLLTLLAEKRQATISHAVTRGLNPNAPMKDSSVPWLGEVPAHWEVKPLYFLAEDISYGFTNPMPTVEDGPYLLTANDIAMGHVRYEQARRTSIEAFSQSLTEKSRPRKGDVLITKDGTLGRVALFDGLEACINQSVARVRMLEDIASSEFVAIAFVGSIYQERMIGDAGGTTIKHIYITRLGKMSLALPPLPEQAVIVEFLRNEIAKLGNLEREAYRAILLLKERRSALIAAAVTGKIDVRQAA